MRSCLVPRLTYSRFLFDPPHPLTQVASEAGVSAPTTSKLGTAATSQMAQPAASATALPIQTSTSTATPLVSASPANAPISTASQSSLQQQSSDEVDPITASESSASADIDRTTAASLTDSGESVPSSSSGVVDNEGTNTIRSTEAVAGGDPQGSRLSTTTLPENDSQQVADPASTVLAVGSEPSDPAGTLTSSASNVDPDTDDPATSQDANSADPGTALSSTTRNAASVIISLLANAPPGNQQQETGGAGSTTGDSASFVAPTGSSQIDAAALVGASGGTSTVTALQGAISSPALATFAAGSGVLTASQDPSRSDVVALGSTTLSVGGTDINVLKQTVSLGTQGLVIANDDTTSTATFITPSAGMEFGDSSGTSAIVFGESMSGPALAMFAVGSSILTASWDPSRSDIIELGSTALSVGGSGFTTLGQTVSLGSQGLVIASGDTTRTASFATPSASTEVAASGVVSTVALQETILGPALTTFAAGSGALTASLDPSRSDIVEIGSTTLSVGGPGATTFGQTVSLGSQGLVIASGDMTRTVAFAASATATELGAVSTLGLHTLTAQQVGGSNDLVELDGTSLSSGGPALMLDGYTLSLGSAGLLAEDPATVALSTTLLATMASFGGVSNSISTSGESGSLLVPPTKAVSSSPMLTPALDSGTARPCSSRSESALIVLVLSVAMLAAWVM